MLDESTIRTLAATRCAPLVVSFYLDVDGSSHPRPSDYMAHADHLCRLARKDAEALGQFSPAVVAASLERIMQWLDRGLDRSRTRGVAVFAAGERGLFEALALPVPVRDQVDTGIYPDVAQLVEILAESRPALVVALDNEHSRLIRMGPGQIEEVEGPFDQIDRQVDTDVEVGGFQRHHEELARRHFRRAAQAVEEELAQRPAEYLVVAASRRAAAEFEEQLPPRLSRLIAGRADVPAVSKPVELARAAAEVLREETRRRHRTLTEDLIGRSAEAAGAVTGLQATLDALWADLLATVVIEKGFQAPGAVCVECRAALAGGETCPRCGGALVPTANVVDVAVADAFSRHVAVEFPEAGMDGAGRIGGFQRRRVASEFGGTHA